ncbi:predicted protein [Botrytis cinerea T4]|uniref:Uncharacterized protein n=1 Tax=Botryotinia fuckeliana (strain T4) TaxID=999810 RepID=G2YG60_BOTF4|nr:predicted protein [Botrytis cinerea T4]
MALPAGWLSKITGLRFLPSSKPESLDNFRGNVFPDACDTYHGRTCVTYQDPKTIRTRLKVVRFPSTGARNAAVQ